MHHQTCSSRFPNSPACYSCETAEKVGVLPLVLSFSVDGRPPGAPLPPVPIVPSAETSAPGHFPGTSVRGFPKANQPGTVDPVGIRRTGTSAIPPLPCPRSKGNERAFPLCLGGTTEVLHLITVLPTLLSLCRAQSPILHRGPSSSPLVQQTR